MSYDDDQDTRITKKLKTTTNTASISNLYIFKSGQWSPLSPSTSSTSSSNACCKSLKLLTYNTWSSSPSHSPHQSQAIIHILRHSKAHIIALQELDQQLQQNLLSQNWLRDNYVISTVDSYWHTIGQGDGGTGKEGRPEAVIVLVRRELAINAHARVSFVKMDNGKGEQGKGLVVLDLDLDLDSSHQGTQPPRDEDEPDPGRLAVDDLVSSQSHRTPKKNNKRIRIITSHFSSLPQNAPLRAAQLGLAQSLLTSPSSPVVDIGILMADFNVSSEAELENVFGAEEGGWRDGIEALAAVPVVVVGGGPSNPTKTNSSNNKSRRHRMNKNHPHPPVSLQDPLNLEPRRDPFRQHATFGSLYPFVAGAPRSKPRKARRIDRVLLFVPPCTRESEGGGGVGFVRGSYEEVGGGQVRDGEGRRCWDRQGREGRMWPSDHLGVAVVVALG
ncbi:hypothetical protein T439DRAFT_376671 [Meredithblackwellia eburnea MCA 4105]